MIFLTTFNEIPFNLFPINEHGAIEKICFTLKIFYDIMKWGKIRYVFTDFLVHNKIQYKTHFETAV